MSDDIELLSTPTVLPIFDGYVFLWGPEKIQITATRIRDTKAVSDAEILVSTVAIEKSTSPLIIQTKLNLVAADPRLKLAGQLSRQFPRVEWDMVLDQFCQMLLSQIRIGNPAIIIGDDDTELNELDVPLYMIYPLILEGQVNIIFGDPGSTKTTMALAMMATIASAWQDSPFGLKVADKRQVVLWLDYETDEKTIKYQFKCIKQAYGLGRDCKIIYRHCDIPFADDKEGIKQAIDKYGATIMVVDSLGLACGGDVNTPEPAFKFFAAFRAMNITGLFLAHTAKGTEATKNNSRHVFGTVFFEAQARNIWEIVKVLNENDPDSIAIGLYHRKPPPTDKLHPPLGYRFTFDKVNHETQWTPFDPKSVDELVKRMSAGAQILAFLNNETEGHTPKEIADLTGINVNTVRPKLAELLKHQDYKKDPDPIVTKQGEKYVIDPKHRTKKEISVAPSVDPNVTPTLPDY
jgi:hypothetical protein